MTESGARETGALALDTLCNASALTAVTQLGSEERCIARRENRSVKRVQLANDSRVFVRSTSVLFTQCTRTGGDVAQLDLRSQLGNAPDSPETARRDQPVKEGYFLQRNTTRNILAVPGRPTNF